MSTIVILNGSQQPYINIGVRFGGITINKVQYKYFPEHDAFVRHDFVTKVKKYKTFGQFIEMVKNVKHTKK